MKYTEYLIQKRIADKFNYIKNAIVPNVYFPHPDHECDILLMTPAGYLTEIEIKISISDLKADFKKDERFRSELIKNFYYALPSNLTEHALPLIPENAGLLAIQEHHIIMVKWAIPRKVKPLPMEKQMKLLRLASMKVWNLKERDFEAV